MPGPGDSLRHRGREGTRLNEVVGNEQRTWKDTVEATSTDTAAGLTRVGKHVKNELGFLTFRTEWM